MSGISFKSGLCLAASVATMTTAAQADVLLDIDLSVPNQVTISATSGFSAVTASGSDTVGVYFENFYSAAGGGLNEGLVSSDFTSAENTAGSAANLFRAGAGSDVGLNIFSWTNDSLSTFTAGAVAFSGSGTWTLDSDDYADMLAGNVSGDLYFAADDVTDLPNAVVLGTYRVIPTPGALSLVGIGGIAAIRRRR